MKRKLFVTLTLALFAVGAVITTNVAQNDVSMEDIRVMAMADHTTPTAPDDPESGGGAGITCNSPGTGGMCQYCYYYDVYTNYGWGYQMKCNWSGVQEDWCSSSCVEGGGSY